MATPNFKGIPTAGASTIESRLGSRRAKVPPVSDEPSTWFLVSAAQKGDRDALDRLFRRHLPRVRQIVAFRVGCRIRDVETVEDLVQETAARAIAALPGFEPGSDGSFRNWLARCAETAVADRFRRLQAGKRGPGKVRAFSEIGTESGSLSASIFAAEGPTPSEVAMGKEADERLEEAMRKLPEHDREAIILRKLCGMSYTEVAKNLGFEKEGSARQAVARALYKLKLSLEV